MPQISIIKYKDVLEARRYDAEYFSVQEIIKKIEKMSSVELNIVSKWITQGPNPKFVEKGIPCLTGRNIASGEIVLENSDLIDEEEYANLKRFTLEKNDILITLKGAGSTGKISLFDINERVIFSRNIGLIRLKKESEISPFYLFSLFSSGLGQKIIDRGVTGGTGQLTLPTGFLRKIKIPILPQSFQLEIEQIVKSAHQKQALSKQLHKEAEELLLAELGLLNYQVNHSLWFSTTKKEIEEAHRYDSEYFQPKYAEIIEKIEKYEGGWDLISNIGKFKNGSFITDKYYVPCGKRAYIRIKELSLDSSLNKDEMIFIDDNFIPTNETIVKENEFVFATIGNTIGKVNLITKEFEGSYPSNNTSKFSLNKAEYPFFYETLFRSFIVQEQIQRYFTQTAQPKISNDQLAKIKIPLIKPSIQKQIAEKIQESHKLRKESKELLEDAKRKVEEEIEKN